ncbi:MAG: hypothetical protein AAGJ31_13995, partial [Verrucomicrobiota bacterium]
MKVNTGAELRHFDKGDSTREGLRPMNWPGVLSWGWIGCLLPLLSGCGGSGEGASGEAVMEEKSGLPNPSGPEVALPEGMVRIPGGSFLMGSYSGMPNEQPVHRVK